MRAQTELYSLADRVFFDHPERWNPGEEEFSPVTDPTLFGWTRSTRDGWVGFTPAGHALPWQGWKIHVSAVPEHAQECLKLVSAVLIERGTAFKYLRRPSLLRATNLKYAPRSASGKFITIYPVDDAELSELLQELDLLVQHLPGPYILSDLRFRSGPLFVRFGGFRPRYCLRADGERCLAVSRPDGILVPDERTPGFTVPDWVEVPEILRESLAGRSGGEALPYTVESALHFSNGGGVYLARQGGPDGTPLVLKEARPWAGLSGDGVDAVARLHREADALQVLSGIEGIPALIGRHRVWEHHFLAVEHVPGKTLQAWVAEHNPLIGANPDDPTRDHYVRQVRAVLDRVRTIVTAIHRAGHVMGDLHPGNILVDGEDRVGLVDFESTVPISDATRQANGHAGFVKAGAAGVEIDRHALDVLALWMFLPMTELLSLAPERRPDLTAIAREQFPTASDLLDVGPAPARTDAVGPRAPGSLGRAVLAEATPERADRLFPGDLAQFEPGQGAAFGHGAAGVLWALDVCGRSVPADHLDWLERAALRPGLPAGFLDGAAGVAHVLARLGRSEPADRLLRSAAEVLPDTTDVSLGSGLAGIGWALLHAAPDATRSWQLAAAGTAADAVIGMIDDGGPHGVDTLSGAAGRLRDAGTGAGLLRGWSGAALFLHQLYRRTGDRDLLAAAGRAVHRDLALCVRAGNGSLQSDGGFRSWPYLELGSAGIALVVDEILDDVRDPALEAALPALAAALRSTFVVDAHLGRGRAGLMATAARLAATRPCLGTTAIAVEHLSRLHWHRVDRGGEWAFPGDGLHRLSMDFLTGTAGVLAAVTSTVRPDVPFLPFLPQAHLRRAPHFGRPIGAESALLSGSPTSRTPEGGTPCPFSICS